MGRLTPTTSPLALLPQDNYTRLDPQAEPRHVPTARVTLDPSELELFAGHRFHGAPTFELHEFVHEGRHYAPLGGILPFPLECRLCGARATSAEVPSATTLDELEQELEVNGHAEVAVNLSTDSEQVRGDCPMAAPGAMDYDVVIEVPSGRLALVDYLPAEADEAIESKRRHDIGSIAGQLRYGQLVHQAYGMARVPNHFHAEPWAGEEDPQARGTLVISNAWSEDEPEDDADSPLPDPRLHSSLVDRLIGARSIPTSVWAVIAGDAQALAALPGYDEQYAARVAVLDVEPGRWSVHADLSTFDDSGWRRRIMTLTRLED